jgi:uncharacterized protein
MRHELDREDSLRLLASVPVGRIVFTVGGLPAVQPVNFVLEDERLLFRTREGSKLVAVRSGTVVAFEADQIDTSTGSGWSVTIVGEARILDEPEATPYRNGGIISWAAGIRDDVVAISTPLVVGRRLTNGFVHARRSA